MIRPHEGWRSRSEGSTVDVGPHRAHLDAVLTGPSQVDSVLEGPLSPNGQLPCPTPQRSALPPPTHRWAAWSREGSEEGQNGDT